MSKRFQVRLSDELAVEVERHRAWLTGRQYHEDITTSMALRDLVSRGLEAAKASQEGK